MKKFLLFTAVIVAGAMNAQTDLTVKADGLMFVTKGAHVYVTNNVTVDAQDYTTGVDKGLIVDSDSDEFGVLYVDGVTSSNSGNAEYRRWVNGLGATVANDFLSPPFAGQTYKEFFDANRAGTGTGGHFSGVDILPYSPSNEVALFGPFSPGDIAYQYIDVNETSLQLASGVGYLASARTDIGDDLTTLGSSLTVNDAQKLVFRGAIESDDVSLNVVSATSASQFYLPNLLGNPYSTYLSADDVLDEMATLAGTDPGDLFANDGVVIIYDAKDNDISATTPNNGSDSSTWDFYNNLTGGLNIAPGQGFYVVLQDESLTGTIDLTEEMRVKGMPANTDDFISGRAMNPFNIDGHFKILLSDQVDANYSTDLYFIDNNATRDADPGYDARVFDTPEFSIATRLVEDSTGNPLAIQALDTQDLFNNADDLVIPLHIRAAANNTYTISIQNVVLPSGATIYLHDTLDDSLTLLNDTNYTFTLDANTSLNGTGRFFIKTSSASLSTQDFDFNNLEVISLLDTKQLRVQGQLISDTTLSLIDVSGRLVTKFELKADLNSTERFVNVNDISQGVYIAKLDTNNNLSKSFKLIIK